MDTIKTVAAALCGALVAAGVFAVLVPSAGMDRFVKLAVRLFFLLCIAAPLLGNRVELDFNASRWFSAGQATQADLSALAEAQLIETFTANVEDQTARILQRYDIFPEKIEVSVHIGETQSIDITTIEITLEEESGSLGEALAEIERVLGTAAIVCQQDAE